MTRHSVRSTPGLFLTCFATAFSLQAIASEPLSPPQASDIERLLRQLGADSYQARNDAMAELIAAGPAVVVDVRAATSSTDAEVQYRAERILREIDRNLLADRREVFLSGDTSQLKQNLPSWQRLAGLTGNTKAARQLFLRMQVEAQPLLDAVESDPPKCSGLITEVYQTHSQSRRFGGQGITAGVLEAALFVASDDSVQLDTNAQSQIASLLSQSISTMEKEDDAVRRVLGQFFARARSFDVARVYQLLNPALQSGCPEGVDLALKVMGDGRYGRHNNYVAQGLLTIGAVGGKEHLSQVERRIGNSNSIGHLRSKDGTSAVKLGDVALAMCIVLTDQKLKDYGFKDASEGRPSSLNFQPYGFRDDESRKKAVEKWRQWRSSQAKAAQ